MFLKHFYHKNAQNRKFEKSSDKKLFDREHFRGVNRVKHKVNNEYNRYSTLYRTLGAFIIAKILFLEFLNFSRH